MTFDTMTRQELLRRGTRSLFEAVFSESSEDCEWHRKDWETCNKRAETAPLVRQASHAAKEVDDFDIDEELKTLFSQEPEDGQ